MEIKKIKNVFIQKIFSALKAKGFVFKVKGALLINTENNEFNKIIQFSFTKLRNSIIVQVFFLLECRSLQFFLKNIIKEGFSEMTLGGEINNFSKNNDTLLIRNEQDIEFIIDIIVFNIESFAIPFFEKYSNLNEIEYELNTNIKMSNLAITYIDQALKGITLSKILGRENYREIKKEYLKELETIKNQSFIDLFNTVVAVLESSKLGSL